MMSSMFNRSRFVFLAVAAGILTACASGGSSSAPSPTPSARYAWNSNPTRIAGPVTGSPSTDLLRGKNIAKWHQVGTASPGKVGSFVLSHNGAGSTPDFELTGTGVQPTQQLLSPTIDVQPGHTYAVSAWIDGSKIERGATVLFISNPAGTETYDEALVRPGPAARHGFTTQIPDGVTKIQIGFYTHGCVLPKGRTVRFAAPAIAPVSGRV